MLVVEEISRLIDNYSDNCNWNSVWENSVYVCWSIIRVLTPTAKSWNFFPWYSRT